MKTRKRLTMTMTSLLVIGLAVPTAAQTTPAGPPSRGGRQAQRNGAPPQAQGPVNMMRAENRVQEQWNAFVLTQSRKFLDINPEQLPNFLAKMMAVQEIRDRHLRDRRRLLMELARMTAPNNETQPADDVLLTKARQLDELEAQTAQLERTALAEIDDVLTPFQRARFRVFEDRMEERKLEMLATVKGNVPAQPAGQAGGAANPAVKPIGRGGGGK